MKIHHTAQIVFELNDRSTSYVFCLHICLLLPSNFVSLLLFRIATSRLRPLLESDRAFPRFEIVPYPCPKLQTTQTAEESQFCP